MIALLIITLLLYSVSAAYWWRQLSANQLPASWFIGLPIVALVTHASFLALYLVKDQFDHSNIASSLSVVGLILVFLSLFRNQRRTGLLLRPVIYVFAAVTCVIVLFSPASWGVTVSANSGLIVHIILSLLAYAVLMLATLYAIQLLYLTHLLKRHKTHALANYLPPLMAVEKYFFRLVTAGTVLLLLAISSGFVFLDNMLAQNQAHKTILSSLAAALYLLVVVLHSGNNRRGRWLVVTSVVASGLLTLAYFGSRFVLDVLLS